MNDFDRKLINLIDDVTGGAVLNLGDLVDDCEPILRRRHIERREASEQKCH